MESSSGVVCYVHLQFCDRHLTRSLCSLNSSSDMMSPYFQNDSCNAFYRPNGTCELGGYVSYSISVSEPEDAAAGLRFAKENNVRLVIRNTGHE